MASGKLLLGLDIGSSGAKICLLRANRDSYAVEVVDSAPFANDAVVDGQVMDADSVTEVIRELVLRNKIKQKQCAIAISGYNVITKRLRMPDMTDDELRENLKYEVEQQIPYNYEDVIVDTVVLERNAAQKKMEIMLVASKKDVVRDYISIVRKAGLEVKVVDTVSFALNNMADVAYQSELQNSVVGIINVGAAMTSLMMIVNGMPAFTRDITIGGNQISEEIQKRFGIRREDADAFKTGKSTNSSTIIPKEVDDVTRVVSENIAGEIKRSITFFYETTGCDHIDRLLLCGGSIKNATTKNTLENAFGVPTIVVNPFEKLDYNRKLYDSQSLEDKALESAVAFGLSLRSASE